MAVHFDEVWDDEGCNEMCDTCRNGKGVCVCDFKKFSDLAEIPKY